MTLRVWEQAELWIMRRLYILTEEVDRARTTLQDWARENSWEVFYISYTPSLPDASDDDALRLNARFSQSRPDVILTVGDGPYRCTALRRLPRHLRQRWIHIPDWAADPRDRIGACYEKAILKRIAPDVSVFTTTYCSGERIDRAFRSLRVQTCPEWEWVILDDSPTTNTTDSTWDRLVRLAEQDCRIRLYRAQHPRGDIGAVKRDAALLCHGRYLLELDHDDELLPEAIETVCSVMDRAEEDVGMAFSDYAEVYEEDGTSHCYGSQFGMNFGAYYRTLWNDRWVNTCRTPPINAYTLRHIVGVPNHVRVWRASAYRALGGHDSRLNVADDYDLILRTFLHYRLVRIPRLLYIQYRNREDNNFTVHRNALIQHLVRFLCMRHDDAIHMRLVELGGEDPVYPVLRNKRVQPPPMPPYMDWPSSPCRHDRDMDVPASDRSVSIVLTASDTRFDEKNLHRIMTAVLQQTWTEWVLYIIGEDKDPTVERIVERFPDPRLRYWVLPESYQDGGATTRNYACRMLVTTEWIVYTTDGSPSWHPSTLQTVRDWIESTSNGETGYARILPPLGEEVSSSRNDPTGLIHPRAFLEKYGYWKSCQKIGMPSSVEMIDRWTSHGETADILTIPSIKSVH